jgi:hypothetical protein
MWSDSGCQSFGRTRCFFFWVSNSENEGSIVLRKVDTPYSTTQPPYLAILPTSVFQLAASQEAVSPKLFPLCNGRYIFNALSPWCDYSDSNMYVYLQMKCQLYWDATCDLCHLHFNSCLMALFINKNIAYTVERNGVWRTGLDRYGCTVLAFQWR